MEWLALWSSESRTLLDLALETVGATEWEKAAVEKVPGLLQ